MNREQIRSVLGELRPHIGAEFRASVEGFFGSRAREDASETDGSDTSDLDVLVRFDDDASLYDLVGLGDFLEGVFHCNVDIVSARTLSDELEQHISEDLVRV